MNPRQVEILKSLFRMTWADGDASDEEVEILSRLLARLGLPLAARVVALDLGLSNPDVPEDQLESVLPDRESRLEAMEMLLSVCFSDGRLDPRELDYVREVAGRLGLHAQDLEALRRKIQG
ncbi:MAG: TerB family tellurite resistance protein [Candidatus Eremiobacterota bacterium]